MFSALIAVCNFFSILDMIFALLSKSFLMSVMRLSSWTRKCRSVSSRSLVVFSLNAIDIDIATNMQRKQIKALVELKIGWALVSDCRRNHTRNSAELCKLHTPQQPSETWKYVFIGLNHEIQICLLLRILCISTSILKPTNVMEWGCAPSRCDTILPKSNNPWWSNSWGKWVLQHLLKTWSNSRYPELLSIYRCFIRKVVVLLTWRAKLNTCLDYGAILSRCSSKGCRFSGVLHRNAGKYT